MRTKWLIYIRHIEYILLNDVYFSYSFGKLADLILRIDAIL